MYTGNLIYQAERPLSRTEQQQVDIANAELVRAVSRCWHALAAPLRALRGVLRAAGRPTRRPASYEAAQYPAAEYPAAEYPAAERLTECRAGHQAGECLPGRAA
jgi:hypothetical protein